MCSPYSLGSANQNQRAPASLISATLKESGVVHETIWLQMYSASYIVTELLN